MASSASSGAADKKANTERALAARTQSKDNDVGLLAAARGVKRTGKDNDVGLLAAPRAAKRTHTGDAVVPLECFYAGRRT